MMPSLLPHGPTLLVVLLFGAAAHALPAPGQDSGPVPEGMIALQGKFRAIPVLNAHEVYFSPDLQERVFLTFGLPEGRPPFPEGVLSPLGNDDFLVFLRDSDRHRYSVIFSGMKSEKAQKLLEGFRARFQKSAPVLETVQRALLPWAEAASPEGCASAGAVSGPISNAYSELARQATRQGELLRSAWACYQGQFQGIWDATGGAVVSLSKGLYNLVVHPVDTWEAMRLGFDRFVDFVGDFSENMNRIGGAIAALPLEEKAHLLCSFLSSIATDVAIAILTGGSGSPLVAKELAAFSNRILGLQGFLSRMAKLGGLRAVLGEKFLARLARGGIGTERIQTLELLSNHGLVDLAKEAATCGL